MVGLEILVVLRTENWMVMVFGLNRPCVTCLIPSFNYSSLHQREDAFKLWGEPTSVAEVAELFAKFCLGQLAALPWSDQAPAIETSVISEKLARMNRLGFLTINSQPAVDGARSDDKVFGWGPSNGYVYQKVSIFTFPAG